MLAVLAGLLQSVPAVGEESGSAVVPVSYTTGQQGHKLKWVPYRPSLPKPEVPAVAPNRMAQHTSPELSAPLIPPAAPTDSSAFADPFEDSKAKPVLAVPLESAGDAPLAAPATEPGHFSYDLLDQLPDQPAGRPTDRTLDQQDEALAQTRVQISGDCEQVKKDLKPIEELGVDVSATDGKFPPECTISEESSDPNQMRDWGPTTYTWKASGLCHKPLYFEDVHLERYGHSWGPYVQPIISGGHFFLTVPVLPYKMGLYPPGECMYTLGYYRPGSCAPYLLDPLPLSVRAAVAQAGVWTGLAAAIP